MKITRLKSNKGFTIVELMIALSVLSVILVMATVIMISISSLYTKGVNAASLQNTARTVAADVTSSLQFSDEAPSPCSPSDPAAKTCSAKPVDAGDQVPRPYSSSGVNVLVYAFCIGSVRYSYVMDRTLGTDSSLTADAITPHVLWRDSIRPSAPCQPLDLSRDDVQADSSSSDLPGRSKGFEMLGEHMRLTRFKILEQPASSGVYKVDAWVAYGDNDLLNRDSLGHSTCNGGIGTQFCSAAEITTHVVGRLY